MAPKKCASLLVEVAKKFPFYDEPNAVHELIYALTWYLWDMVDQEVPEWTEALGRELDRLRPGITSKGCHERFAAYNAAKENGDLHIARTFQFYVLGSGPLDLMHTMELWIHLAGLMYGLQKALIRES